VSEALHRPSETARSIGVDLSDIRDVRALARLAGASADELERWQRNYA
jgi:hypothetical protein